MPQKHLVNIQCDNASERALHLTGEEEEDKVDHGQSALIMISLLHQKPAELDLHCF